MTEAPKRRGRKPAVKVEAVEPAAKPKHGLKVKKADAIHDGEGGFLAVGATFSPADDDAAAALVAQGLAE